MSPFRAAMLLVALSLAGLAPAGASDAVRTGTGTFRDGDPVHRGSGTISIETSGQPGQSAKLLMKNLEIAPGPDLFVFLVKQPDPLFPEDVTAQFRSLGKLKSPSGDQDYDVPPDIELRNWGSVVVWCDTFQTMFAVATIEWSQ